MIDKYNIKYNLNKFFNNINIMIHSTNNIDNIIDSSIDYEVGVPSYNCNDAPFMLQQTNEDIIENKSELNEKLLQLEDALSDDIKIFYKKVGSCDQEIYIKNWSLFSINNIINLVNQHRKDGIFTTDIGLIYRGMGWCKIAFYNPETDMIYFRNDGGSNGWDRTDNYTKLKKYKSDKKDKGLAFDEFLNEINENKDETECLF